MSELQLTAEQLAEMVGLIEDGTISGKIAKQILPDLLKVCMPPCAKLLVTTTQAAPARHAVSIAKAPATI